MAEVFKGFKSLEEVLRLAKLAKENGLGVSEDTADVMFGDMASNSGGSSRNWLSKEENDDLLREAKRDGVSGLKEEGFWERLSGDKKDLFDSSGNNKIDEFNEYGKIDLSKIARKDMGKLPPWAPKTEEEWQSRMYANNTAQATDLSYGSGKKPSTFELSDPDTAGIFIQPDSLLHRDSGHVGFIISEKQGEGNAIGYNYGRYTIQGEPDDPFSGTTPGRLLKESYPWRRLENGGGFYYEIATDKEGVRRMHQTQLNFEKKARDLTGREYLTGENTLNRKQFYSGEWSYYDISQRKTCITYTITVIQAAFPVDSIQYIALDTLKGVATTPTDVDNWLKKMEKNLGLSERE